MYNRLEKNLPYYLLSAFLLVFVILALFSEGSVGGADDIIHYMFSRYAFKNPAFFLDPWAKPFFTMLMAPFAQFGYIGVKVLNILLGLAAALLTFLTARRLTYRYPLLALFMLVFTPLYAALMISGMTEILFSFILVLGIYLFFQNRSIWSSIFISLLPFVRTEGVVIFPLFMIAFAVNRQWRAIPFLATGFLFFSVIGSFHYHDFFWVINTMPYTGNAQVIYGTGELLYYVNKHRYIFGPPFYLMIIGGLLYIPVYFFTSGRKTRIPFLNEVLVGFMPFIVYFAAHSYVWWKGSGNSVGEIRVIAAVFPSAVLLALFGCNGILRWLPLTKFTNFFLAVLLAIVLVLYTFRIQKIPVKLSPTQELLKQAANWFEKSEYADKKTFYFDPYWWFLLGTDPTDHDRVLQFLPDVQQPQNNIFADEMIVWDAHYGPNEGRIPLERLMGNPFFELINVFRPDVPFQVLGGYDYEIYIFKRTQNEERAMNMAILEELLVKQDSNFLFQVLDFHDYEYAGYDFDSVYVRNEVVQSGVYSYFINEDIEFIEGLKVPVEKAEVSEGSRIMISLFHHFVNIQEEDPPLMVLSLDHNQVIDFYHAWEIRPEIMQEWETSTFEITLPAWESPNDILSVYIWNRGQNQLYIDGFTIGLKESR